MVSSHSYCNLILHELWERCMHGLNNGPYFTWKIVLSLSHVVSDVPTSSKPLTEIIACSYLYRIITEMKLQSQLPWHMRWDTTLAWVTTPTPAPAVLKFVSWQILSGRSLDETARALMHRAVKDGLWISCQFPQCNCSYFCPLRLPH